LTAIPALRIPEFEATAPGLVAGITTRDNLGRDDRGRAGNSDFGLATGGDLGAVSIRHMELARWLGFSSVAICRQVHGSHLFSAADAPKSGLWIPGDADGLIDAPAGCLLVITVADCVPIYMYEPETASIGLLHAGWRGAAAGIMRRGVERFTERGSDRVAGLRVHLGPAICGNCYEVGPEVMQAMGLEGPGENGLDLREFLRREAIDAGVSGHRVTASTLCTRCDPELFHSHRADGDSAGRMAAFIGRSD